MEIVTLKRPIAEARGILKKRDRYYIRMLDGQCIVQRRPNRKGHVATEKERRHQMEFVRKWGGWNKKAARSPDDVP